MKLAWVLLSNSWAVGVHIYGSKNVVHRVREQTIQGNTFCINANFYIVNDIRKYETTVW